MDKVIDHDTPRCAAETEIRAHQGDGETLRETAMRAIAETRFVPAKGRNRISSMVEGRPDWVLSRQRAWGVTITLFVHSKHGHYLIDPAANERRVAPAKADGAEARGDERDTGAQGGAWDDGENRKNEG